VSEALGFFAYIVVKYAAYTGWCYTGLVWLAPDRPNPARKAAVPVRVLEWTVLHVFVARRFQWPGSVGWILGGVIVSCLADVPLGMMNGGVVPVGRPFC